MEYVILGFLNTRSMSGYELRKSMLNSTGMFYDSSFGTIYPTIKRLKERKLITTEEKPNGNKVVLVHTITQKGKSALLEWLNSSNNALKVRYEFLAKIFFSSNLEQNQLLKSIDNHIGEINQVLNMIRKLESKPCDETDIFHTYTIDFAKDFYAFLYSWHSELKNKLIQGDQE